MSSTENIVYQIQDTSSNRQCRRSASGNFDTVPRMALKRQTSVIAHPFLQHSSGSMEPKTKPVCKPVLTKRRDSFPRFNRGTVYIELVHISKVYRYAFEPEVLARASPWFVETMKQKINESNDQHAWNFKYNTQYFLRYELSYSRDESLWVLHRAPFTMPIRTIEIVQPTPNFNYICPKDSQTTVDSLGTVEKECDLVKMEVEKGERREKGGLIAEEIMNRTESQSCVWLSSTSKTEKAEPPIPAGLVPFEVCEAYNNLFLLFHNLAPNLHSKNIEIALEQMERLINISMFYHYLGLVRPSLSSHLFNFGHDLFKAIIRDPPRWLKISLHLEDGPIFKEAMVHIIGQWPYFPWKTSSPSDLPNYILDLIRDKYDQIRSLKAKVDQTLFTSSIYINGQPVTLNNSAFETWVAVSYWREWLASALEQSNDPRNVGNRNGTMYRLMDQGGNAYLSIALISEDLKYLDQVCDLQEVSADLGIMKAFANTAVSELCVNNSKLDIKAAGIEHLTCCKVDTDDLPWVKDSGLKMARHGFAASDASNLYRTH